MITSIPSVRCDRVGTRPGRRLRDRRILRIEPLESRQLLTTIIVDSLVDELDGNIDDGDISLRDAIEYTNANPGIDTIRFDLALSGGIILLDRGLGELQIRDSLSLDAGNLPGGLTIDANDPTPSTMDGDGIRALRVETPGVVTDVIVQGLTITGADVYGAGGGILSEERLTIIDSKITGNKCTFTGGGVAAIGPTWIQSSVVSGNISYGGGGGVAVVGTAMVEYSVISSNWSLSRGGGLFVTNTNGASLTLKSSVVSTNASLNDGGGIWAGAGSQTKLESTTISGNLTVADGGGIYAYLDGGTFDIRYSTIADNVANLYGSGGNGGGLSAQGPGVARLRHTLVGNNTQAGGIADDVAGDIWANFCLIQSNRSGATIVGFNNVLYQDPLLGALADNGGPTRTHALMLGSPAINAGDFQFHPPPEFDQRGAHFVRRYHLVIDIGAFEWQPVVASADFNDDGLYNYQDIDALVAEIAAGTHGLAFDLTGDGRVDLADRDHWLAAAGEVNLGPGKAYLLGDATLDGVVDGRDFIVWNVNKFRPVNKWSAGDFNADGNVDGQDFIAWNDNKFKASAAVYLPDRLLRTRELSHAEHTLDRGRGRLPWTISKDADQYHFLSPCAEVVRIKVT